MSDSRLTDRLSRSICRQFAEAFHDVFGEEHPPVFVFFVTNRVIADRVDNVDIGRVYGCAVGKPKDVDEFVNEHVHVDNGQCRCCRSGCR